MKKMKIKKYPQSHLTISDGNSKIVIDPGNITFKSGFKPNEFFDAQAFLITHSHSDHMDPENIKTVVLNKPVFGNADVCRQLQKQGINCTQVQNGQEFNAGGFKVKAIDLPHCKMQDGTDGPPNTGFIINDVFFHPGDGDVAPEGLVSDDLALPIAGPTITLDGALKFAEDVQAKVVIPIHYDYFKNDPQQFKSMTEDKGIEVRILSAGQETEI